MLELPAALVPLFAVWSALVGAAVGSFLNVLIARVPAGESIVRPGSRCPRCKTPIRWYDNMPVVSWLVLRARCRACGARISARYPLVEALGASVAVVAFARHGFSGAAVAELAFAAALLALAFIDLDTWLLPNAITWPLIAFGLAMGLVGVTPVGSLRGAAYGAGLGFAAFALIGWLGEKAFKKEALGFGDVWLLAGLGAWMGPAALLPIVLLASIQGSVVGLALILLGKGQRGPTTTAGDKPPPYEIGTTTTTPTPIPIASTKTTPTLTEDDWVPPKNAVPFGPFLVAGALEWLWLGGFLAQAIPLLRLFR
jgi:leader peptidase (prepilin peptidase)/N-methyltransferase